MDDINRKGTSKERKIEKGEKRNGLGVGKARGRS